MEDVPPSYEFATNRDAWAIVAHYIPSSDLCAASLVCRRWHQIFAPFLWGDPASHFGKENDAVYVALTRFKRTLKRARLSVRQLTHTLHLPPALSEIYGGPRATWLRDVLEYLPRLQSLLVSKLPFFDHHSLVALRHASNDRQSDTEDHLPTYGLRLLLAAREPNTTSIGIAEALTHFPFLVYLDLSYTTPARDPSVLYALGKLYDLQVLKLRGVGLRDAEAEILANAIGIRVRLLDLRNNLLTDSAVRSLMQACFLPPEKRQRGSRQDGRAMEDWPVGLPPGPDLLSLDSLWSEDLDHNLIEQLTNPLTGRLAFEDLPHKGLTHLYIADNQISVEGLAGLLKSTRLHLLDGGTVDTAQIIKKGRSPSSPTGLKPEPIKFPGVEKLVPILGTFAPDNLTYLRVHHAVVTQNPPTRDVPSPATSTHELPGEDQVFELDNTRFELDAAEPVFELSAEAPEPKFELPGDCIHFALSPPVNHAPETSASEQAKPEIKCDGAFAPEVVTNGHTSDDEEDEVPILNASGTGLTTKKSKSARSSLNIPRDESLPEAAPEPPAPPSPSALRAAQIETLLAKRPNHNHNASPISPETSRPSHSNPFPYLHPSHLPQLRTLILTDVPTTVPASSPVLTALTRFITACASESLLATLQTQTNYSLPPGRSRASAEHQHAKSLFALERIVLEMAAPPRKPTLTSWKHHAHSSSYNKSSTGDLDSENLWSAASNDFSFFGEDECGIPENEPEKYFPMASLNEKVILSPDDESGTSDVPGTPRSGRSSLSEMISPGTPTILQSPRSFPLGRSRPTSFTGSSTAATANTSAPRPILPGDFNHHMTNGATLNGTLRSDKQYQQAAPEEKDEKQIDVVSSLATFRRAKKAEYEAALLIERRKSSASHTNNNPFTNGTSGTLVNGKAPAISPSQRRTSSFSSPAIAAAEQVEGYWKGEVKIVRNAAPKGRSGVVDVYGNYFEKGYLYP